MRSAAIAVFCGFLTGWATGGSLCAQQESPLVRYTDNGSFRLEGSVRAFNRNDHRIIWSGVEATYGAEAVLRPSYETEQGLVTWRASGEFFLNQPVGPVLSDPVRDLFRANFTVPPFQIFQLALEAEAGDWRLRFGRFATPLGGYHAPLLTNALLDAPFLQTEVIGFAETGMLIGWRPGSWAFDFGVTNGEFDLDTNSSKALLARVGFEQPHWAVGLWIKAQDGMSSEQQKRFNSFVGADARVWWNDWSLYAAGLLDEHGLYRDIAQDGNPYALGVRSLYGRDAYRSFRRPSHGGGFHVGATRRTGPLLVDVNYGAYFPQVIGQASHDAPIHRTMIKWVANLAPRFDVYLVLIRENSRPQPYLELNNYGPRALVIGGKFEF